MEIPKPSEPVTGEQWDGVMQGRVEYWILDTGRVAARDPLTDKVGTGATLHQALVMLRKRVTGVSD